MLEKKWLFNDLESFILKFYPPYQLSKENLDFYNEKYLLIERKSTNIVIETTNLLVLEEYMRKNLFYDKAFLSFGLSELIRIYLDFEKSIEIQPLGCLTFFNVENNKKLNYEELYYFAKNYDFSLEPLLNDICPECKSLYFKSIKKDNAIIFKCKCGFEKIQLL